MKELELTQMENVYGGELSPFDCYKAGLGVLSPSIVSQVVNITVFYLCWNSEE